MTTVRDFTAQRCRKTRRGGEGREGKGREGGNYNSKLLKTSGNSKTKSVVLSFSSVTVFETYQEMKTEYTIALSYKAVNCSVTFIMRFN
jgi:hypothetical protein